MKDDFVFSDATFVTLQLSSEFAIVGDSITEDGSSLGTLSFGLKSLKLTSNIQLNSDKVKKNITELVMNVTTQMAIKE